MKKRKMLKNVSLVALSAVMACGVAAAFTGCSNDTYTLTVSIFCNDSDEHTNRTICENWAKKYSEENNIDISVDLSVNNSKDDYFKKLDDLFQSDSAEDIIYLSPKYVKNWAEIGRVMDLSEYILTDTDMDPKADTVAALGNVWQNGFSYYGYRKGDDNYVPGQAIKYDASQDKIVAESDGKAVGVYGLPKDYSNFAMGYNKKFFTDALKKAYQTTKPSKSRSVQGGYNETAKLTFTGTQANGNAYERKPVTYATGGDGYKVGDVDMPSFKANDEAPIINIGIPTRYRTFNFYRYVSYDDALNAGDPMATACQRLTGGEGYVVTIPGFPGETFDVAEQYRDKTAGVPYDTATGHIVFTYAEFGAITWAVTYYLNTFDWDSSDPTTGQGGIETSTVGQMNVFGNEQYEGAQGNPLYLLTWLAANDADFINSTSTKAMNSTNANGPDTSSSEIASTLAGTNSEKVKKLNLDGSYREVDVQYGVDSKNFIETYGAFHEYGSTWNGNSGNAGDSDSVRSESGWDLFRLGAGVFYGAGTWDAATRNESVADYFEFGEMPAPVAEKYALYTATKDADYNYVYYSNTATAKGTGNGAANDGSYANTRGTGLKVYSHDDIVKNQLLRQDKWAARMDSVGYAANARLLNTVGTEEEWKIQGAASLIMALTINEEAQKTLTYAGAQLPNFKAQCIDFLNYQTAGKDGKFSDMITPAGFYDTTDAATGKAIWDHYYDIAQRMAKDSYDTSKNGVTVGEWIQANAKDYGSDAVARYDEQYKDVVLSKFVGSTTRISFSMKVLRMVNFDKTDRDLNIRMQYGLNSVRDSSMYTFNAIWISKIDPSQDGKMLAYIMQRKLTDTEKDNFANIIQKTPNGNGTFWTPAVYCIRSAKIVQDDLQDAINREKQAILASR